MYMTTVSDDYLGVPKNISTIAGMTSVSLQPDRGGTHDNVVRLVRFSPPTDSFFTSENLKT